MPKKKEGGRGKRRADTGTGKEKKKRKMPHLRTKSVAAEEGRGEKARIHAKEEERKGGREEPLESLAKRKVTAVWGGREMEGRGAFCVLAHQEGEEKKNRKKKARRSSAERLGKNQQQWLPNPRRRGKKKKREVPPRVTRLERGGLLVTGRQETVPRPSRTTKKKKSHFSRDRGKKKASVPVGT